MLGAKSRFAARAHVNGDGGSASVKNQDLPGKVSLSGVLLSIGDLMAMTARFGNRDGYVHAVVFWGVMARRETILEMAQDGGSSSLLIVEEGPVWLRARAK